MNYSAFSDDGKFSTKALRQFATQDIEYEGVNRRAPEIPDGDMRLSTHVEFSDKGSRKYPFHHNEERIVEEDEEGSGRTSPPGTIGEVHEYMSENIGPIGVNKIDKRLKVGNQSVSAQKDNIQFQNVAKHTEKEKDKEKEKEEQDIEAVSTFAVIREKIPLTNDNKHIVQFKTNYDKLFDEFHEQLVYEYSKIKQQYIIDFEANYYENLDDVRDNVGQFIEKI